MPGVAATKSQSSSQNGHASPAEVIDFLVPQAMETMMRMHGDVFGACMTCNREMLDFFKERFEEDKKLVATVTASKEARDILDAYMEFWRKASIDYAEEASKLANMNSEMATETLKHMNENTNVV